MLTSVQQNSHPKHEVELQEMIVYVKNKGKKFQYNCQNRQDIERRFGT